MGIVAKNTPSGRHRAMDKLGGLCLLGKFLMTCVTQFLPAQNKFVGDHAFMAGIAQFLFVGRMIIGFINQNWR